MVFLISCTVVLCVAVRFTLVQRVAMRCCVELCVAVCLMCCCVLLCNSHAYLLFQLK